MVKVKHNGKSISVKTRGTHLEMMTQTENIIKCLLTSIKKHCERIGFANDFDTLRLKLTQFMYEL